jgi:hypothetical protein
LSATSPSSPVATHFSLLHTIPCPLPRLPSPRTPGSRWSAPATPAPSGSVSWSGRFFRFFLSIVFQGPDGNDLYDRRSALGNNDGSPVGLDIVHDGKAAVLEDADSYLLRGVLLTPMVIET